MNILLLRAAFVLSAILGLAMPRALFVTEAPKALVYCPVGIDDAGCNAIVTALSNASYVVDRGYDGSGGTVDLKTVDYFAYSVVMVPSLADDGRTTPYAGLRDPHVAPPLKAALIGGIAVYSGTPDAGSANRAEKDALIQNLAAWAGKSYAAAHGPGLVSFIDLSETLAGRYDWLRAMTPLQVASDDSPDAFASYDSVRALTPTGGTILS